MSARLEIRPARAQDLERIVEIHACAFPDQRDREARAQHFLRNPFGGLEDVWVAAAGGTVLGHAFLYSLQVWFGGARVPCAGIASLGVAPEARSQGVGSTLIERLHGAARERGDALAILYPFRQNFYRRLGYAATSTHRRLRFPPSSIQAPVERAARAASGADREALRACWDAAAFRGTGALARTERLWDARLCDERRVWIVVEGDEGVEGYVSFTLHPAEQPGGARSTKLTKLTKLWVREWAAKTAAGERSLWGVIGAQRYPVAVVRMDVPADDPLERALVDGECPGAVPDEADPGDHVAGEIVGGPMLRTLDVERALEARGWLAEDLTVQTEDARFTLVAKGGSGRVLPAQSEPDITLDRAALAAVAFGALKASHADRLGWLRVRDPRTLGLADALFALPPYFSAETF